MSLPPASAELGPDGLPVTGVRCTWDGAGFDCGQCRTDGDCPANQGCVVNGQTRRFECMASECEEDGHCFPGFLCRAVTSGATGGTIIRRCVREGLRGLGEPCDMLPVSPLGSCREGLVCVGQVCAARCRLDDPSSCPAGHTCLEELDGAGCMPDCRWLGCAEGLKCQQVRGDDYRCLASARGDCRETPCPEGEHCNVRGSRGRAVFWCARLCNPLQPASCPEGQICGMGSATVSTCYRRCEPTVPDSCGEGWTCATISEDMTLWGCRPELAP